MNIFTTPAVALLLVFFASIGEAGAQDQSEAKRITDDPAQDGFPVWSPDGRRLLFSRFGADIAPEKTGLWLVPSDGGTPSQLVTVIAEHPNWSADGRYIVFDGDSGKTIQLVSAAGGSPIRIVPESIPVERGGQPKWSPDGSHIAFKEGPRLWILEVSTGRFDTLLSERNTLPIPLCWSKTEKEIYVLLRDAGIPHSSIWAIAVDGTARRQVTLEKESTYRYADLSPDGSLLAVVRCEGRNCNLWVMPSRGGRQVRITEHAGYDDGPTWSPDGKRIAFVSTRSGNFDIWTMSVDTERIRRELGMEER